jgi:hypothetical protein
MHGQICLLKWILIGMFDVQTYSTTNPI